jgi:hypothetical protein
MKKLRYSANPVADAVEMEQNDREAGENARETRTQEASDANAEH